MSAMGRGERGESVLRVIALQTFFEVSRDGREANDFRLPGQRPYDQHSGRAHTSLNCKLVGTYKIGKIRNELLVRWYETREYCISMKYLRPLFLNLYVVGRLLCTISSSSTIRIRESQVRPINRSIYY